MRERNYKHITLKWTIKTFSILILPCLIMFTAIIIPYSYKVYAAATTTNTSLQNSINIDNQQISNLNKKIAEYQSELTKVGADKKTLKSAINALTTQRKKIETQISVTEHQIDTTKLQIKQIGLSIVDTQKTISKNQNILEKYFRYLQETENNQSVSQLLLSAGTIGEAWGDINTILEIQKAINDKIRTLQTQKNKLDDSQNKTKQKQDTLTLQKQILTSQQLSLIATKKSKDQLLAETIAEESKYKALLADAKAQLASFSAFAKNAGGSKLLSNQTSCDTWGCYYNQRDSLWGNNSLNGTKFRLASDGCLVTSMAMVMTHYGYTGVTPQTINSNPDNFATYYPAYLMFTIYIDGISATRKYTTIDTTLATGNPVIVGVHAYGGTHFVVLTSGSNGKYLMRDPYIANAKDISFSAHYSVSKIYEINKVVINK